MSYSPTLHSGQMAASALNEHLIRAMATEDFVRSYHTREALTQFGKLLEAIHGVATGPMASTSALGALKTARDYVADHQDAQPNDMTRDDLRRIDAAIAELKETA